jgi:hypothetical protein
VGGVELERKVIEDRAAGALNLTRVLEPLAPRDDVGLFARDKGTGAPGEWRQFPEESGSLNVPRASMPQVKSEHRGALVQFLKGRGITHSQEEIAPNILKPSQAEFSPAKVEKALSFEGKPRPILVSSDGYVVDGHHQWLAALDSAPDTPIPVIRLDAPIQQTLIEVARFPSSGVDEASAALGAAGETVAAKSSTKGELLRYARDRADYYEAEAAAATNPVKRQNAAALAADFRAEVKRLEFQPDATSDVIRYKGRDIVRVTMPDGTTVQPFYRSTGNNSRRAGAWLPFDGVGRDAQGELFLKERFSSGAMEDPAHPLHRLGSDEMKAVSERLGASDIKPGREVATPDEVNAWLEGAADSRSLNLDRVLEPAHHSHFQPRDGGGKFALDVAEPRASLLRRAFDRGLDVLDVAKSAFASADASAAGRQAFFPLLMDTRATVRGLAEGTAGLKSRDYARFIEHLESLPVTKEALGAGLELDSLTGVRSEFFPSPLAEKIPVYGKGVIAPSDRLMTGQLDAVRLHNYELWANELRAAGLTPEKNPEEFRSTARMINILSGRAELGKLGTAIYPVTRRVIFSPKLLKSRFSVLNPLVWAKLAPRTRRIALRKAGKAAAKLGGLLGMAALVADEVGFDPMKGNFLHVRFGNVTYDWSGGEASKIVAIFKLVQSLGTTAKAIQNRESVQYKDTPFGITSHFLRSQLAPGYSIIPDAVTGRTFDDRPFTWTEGTLRRVTPGFTQDLLEGFNEGGGTTGALKALPSFLGISTRTRDEAAMKKEWALSSRASKEAEAKERTQEVLKDVPAGVRDELQRLRIYLPQSDTASAPAIGETVARAMAAPSYQKFKNDSQRRTYLENLIAATRKRAGMADAERAAREKRAKPEGRITLSGRAGEEVKRLRVVIDPIPAGHGVKVFSGESARFKGENLGQTPAMLEQYRREVVEATQREIDRVMGFSTYAAASDERRRVALDEAAKRARELVRNKFNLGTREREYGERRGLLDYQQRLESRSSQPRPGERVKM